MKDTTTTKRELAKRERLGRNQRIVSLSMYGGLGLCIAAAFLAPVFAVPVENLQWLGERFDTVFMVGIPTLISGSVAVEATKAWGARGARPTADAEAGE